MPRCPQAIYFPSQTRPLPNSHRITRSVSISINFQRHAKISTPPHRRPLRASVFGMTVTVLHRRKIKRIKLPTWPKYSHRMAKQTLEAGRTLNVPAVQLDNVANRAHVPLFSLSVAMWAATIYILYVKVHSIAIPTKNSCTNGKGLCP